jgi:hypothetical protein
MKQLQELGKEIFGLTFKTEQEYPELYQLLDENLMTIQSCEDPELKIKTSSVYLESLRELLKHHNESHQLSQKK